VIAGCLADSVQRTFTYKLRLALATSAILGCEQQLLARRALLEPNIKYPRQDPATRALRPSAIHEPDPNGPKPQIFDGSLAKVQRDVQKREARRALKELSIPRAPPIEWKVYANEWNDEKTDVRQLNALDIF